MGDFVEHVRLPVKVLRHPTKNGLRRQLAILTEVVSVDLLLLTDHSVYNRLWNVLVIRHRAEEGRLLELLQVRGPARPNRGALSLRWWHV